MNISKLSKVRKNTNCRKCTSEIDQEMTHIRIPNSSDLEERRKNFEARENIRKEIIEKKKKNIKYYKLNACTASGVKTEMICEDHLRELRDNINNILDRKEIEN